MNDHDRDDETEYGTPFWTYSDDEDLADLHGDADSTPYGWNDGLILEEILGPPDDESQDAFPCPGRDTPGGLAPAPSREELERLLDARPVSWSSCRHVIEAATALAAWDLVEKAAIRALQVAHEGNYSSEWSLTKAARQILIAKCATATFDGLAEAIADGQARLQAVLDRARRDGRAVLGDAVDGEISRADELLMLLTSADEGSAFARLAAQLRRLGNPKLAEEAASRGIGVDPQNPAPWVARAAARADRRNHRDALADLDQDMLRGNIHAAVTRSRVLRAIGRKRDGLAVALAAAQQQPTKTTLTMLTVLARETGDEHALAEAERLCALVPDAPRHRPPSRLLGLLAAQWLAREGDHEQALLLAEVVAGEGPRWQQADNLVATLRRKAG
jgi:tetratricopeptide (TPR) repeat protein